MRYLYKYPQVAYPYQKLMEKNRQRAGQGLEYELLDTGVFDEDRYFDIFVEYAKADADDICIRIEAFNRGPRCCISFRIFGFGIHGAGPFRVRSLIGLIPLFAIDVLKEKDLQDFPEFRSDLNWFLDNSRDLVSRCCYTDETRNERRHILTVVDQDQLGRILRRVWDPEEFLSPAGILSLSKIHETHPFIYGEADVRYEPAEAIIKLKGGHSNWRGPVWFPTSYLLISALKMFGEAYGPEFVVDLPPSSSERPLSPTDTDRSTAIPPNSRKILTCAIAPCFMNTFTATTVPVWVQVTRRARRGWWRL